MVKKTKEILLAVVVVIFGGLSRAFAEIQLDNLNKAGEQWTEQLKALASGGLGYAVFATALLVGIIALITKRKAIMIGAFAVGILLAIYGNLAQALWEWFKTILG